MKYLVFLFYKINYYIDVLSNTELTSLLGPRSNLKFKTFLTPTPKEQYALSNQKILYETVMDLIVVWRHDTLIVHVSHVCFGIMSHNITRLYMKSIGNTKTEETILSVFQ